MASWFSRRSGSRVSIHNPVRRVPHALSLSRNLMPPRTTRKSDRRKVSDRTMVGTAQPLCLSASGTQRHRYQRMMNLRTRKTHRVSSHDWGWTANTLCPAVAGEAFVLTSPFIEQGYRHVGITRTQMTITGAGSTGRCNTPLVIRSDNTFQQDQSVGAAVRFYLNRSPFLCNCACEPS